MNMFYLSSNNSLQLVMAQLNITNNFIINIQVFGHTYILSLFLISLQRFILNTLKLYNNQITLSKTSEKLFL